jgi:hypothetical protein
MKEQHFDFDEGWHSSFGGLELLRNDYLKSKKLEESNPNSDEYLAAELSDDELKWFLYLYLMANIQKKIEPKLNVLENKLFHKLNQFGL